MSPSLIGAPLEQVLADEFESFAVVEQLANVVRIARRAPPRPAQTCSACSMLSCVPSICVVWWASSK